MVEPPSPPTSLGEALGSHFEWLAVYPEGRTFPMSRDEIDLEETAQKLLIGLHGEKGFRTWRVNAFDVADGEICLRVSGGFGAGPFDLRLVPRTPAANLSRDIELARLVRANEIAKLVENGLPAARVIRVSLNEPGGRMANIIVESPQKTQTAVIADVTGGLTAESLLASSFLWLDRLNQRRKKPVEGVRIVAGKKQARALRKLVSLLNPSARASVGLAEIAGDGLRILEAAPIASLWREKPRKLSVPSEVRVSRTARSITGILPDKIDVLRSKQGETLRFAGLPFARVRTLMGREKAWFGTAKDRRPLTPENLDELRLLVEELDLFRSPDTPNHRHDHFRAAPEWWLESILRRNIKLLDANLVLSPIYNQFRSSTDKIDLLALRRDGRLVIIELKTSPDREMVFQAADYWRKIELQRRRGVLAAARLFGDLEIIDRPALVYAVAPALSFHRDFEYFARKLAPEIELWRFELHEDWRRNIKVLARVEYRDPLRA